LTISNELLLTNLLSHNVRCDKGLYHGPGIIAWMHPPVHRILGWASRPSNLSMSRDVWRLNQVRVISNFEIYMKGEPAISDQATLDRFPTLMEANLLNNKNEKIGVIADFLFNIKTGNILYYLVSRSNPKIPGTSRWRLSIDKILDQQPGLVITNFNSLDDIPIVKSSLRQDLLKNSRKWKEEFKNISLKVNNRLEGWLEDPPWYENDQMDNKDLREYDSYIDSNEYLNDSYYNSRNEFNRLDSSYNDQDPWI